MRGHEREFYLKLIREAKAGNEALKNEVLEMVEDMLIRDAQINLTHNRWNLKGGRKHGKNTRKN